MSGDIANTYTIIIAIKTFKEYNYINIAIIKSITCRKLHMILSLTSFKFIKPVIYKTCEIYVLKMCMYTINIVD